MENPRRLGAGELIARKSNASIGRRRFLGRGFLLVLVGAGRRLWAQGIAPLRYRALARPVVVPLADLSAPLRARSFVATASTLPTAAKPNEPIRISGFIVRTGATDNAPDRFSAVCARCPHEHCDVDFVSNPSELPPEVVQEIGRVVKEPIYICPCHNSTFTTTDGGRLGGPAPRGLYRFRVTRVTETGVEIGEVEEDLLVFG
jgi:Rieske Fe-S protein